MIFLIFDIITAMNIYRKISALAFTACLSAGAASAAVADSVVVDSTFNALDYVLQRPAPAREFSDKQFGDHLFLTIEAGPEWMRRSQNTFRSISTGYRAGVTIGDWITPVHGWRAGVSAGRHNGVGGSNPFFVGLSADYLLNFTGLLKGETAHSRFEFIGAAGVEAQAMHFRGSNWFGAGARLGLQARLNFTPSTFFFVEPRVGVYSDNTDDVKTWHHYDWHSSVMFGFGYRMYRSGVWRRAVDNSQFVNDRFGDNLFAGLTGGVAAFGNNPMRVFKNPAAFAGGYIGKWFAAPSAVRLQVQAGHVKEPGEQRRVIIADLDYMANINTMLNGYDPDRKLEVNAMVGVSMAAASRIDKRFFPGGHLALQGVWNLTHNVGLFIEPQLRLFSSKIMHTYREDNTVVMPEVSAGIVFRSRPSHRRDLSAIVALEEREFAVVPHHFFSVGAGVFGRVEGWEPAASVTFAYGGWFTPQSAWRISLGADNYAAAKIYRSINLSADYMADILSIVNGYDSHRRFSLRGLLGLTASAAHYYTADASNHFVWGAEAGIQAAVRLNDCIELFIEPMAQVLKIPDYTRSVTPQWRVQAGLTYLMGRRPHKSVKGEGHRYFIGAAGGVGVFGEQLYRSSLPVSAGLSIGNWITDVSGVQINADMLHVKPSDVKTNIFSLGLDYMLNLTALLNDGTRADRFNLIGLAGVSVGFGDCDDAKASFGAKIGLQARWSVSDRIDLTLTPSVRGWDSKVIGNNGFHSCAVAATVDAGIAFKF